jgi:23S rRNA pseudouridine1911/1915/1917 synthase
LKTNFIKQLQIIYTDDYFCAINKPANLHSCSISDDSETTLSKIIMLELADDCPYLKTAKDAGLLQRLDYSSSGCIILAKSSEAQKSFKDLLLNEALKKKYLVICEGQLEQPVELDLPIGNPNRGAKKVRVYTHQVRKKDRSLPAFSKLRPLAYNSEINLSLIEVEANLARRHQVRAHCSHLGLPLIGDSLYGAQKSLKELFNLNRDFLLHAQRLSFTHPFKKTKMELKADLELNELNLIKELFKGNYE